MRVAIMPRSAFHVRSAARSFSSKPIVPVVDFSGMYGSEKAQLAVSKQIFEAFKDIGFVSIVNHGIKPQVVQSAFAASKAFFNLSQSEKEKVAWTDAKANRGYLGVGKEALSEGKRDLKETFECGHEADPDYRNLWPEESVLPNFRKTLLTFFYQADKVHLQVLRSIALGMNLPSPQYGTGNYFTPLCNGNHQNLRLLHYPACKRSDASNRAGEHTDYGSITMVFQEKWGGLEVQSRDDKWHHVDPVEGAIVVNIADCLQRWSNDVLRSTRHRVTIDPRIKGDDLPARHSIAMFCNPNKETLVEALPGTGAPHYKPINAYDYLIGRLVNTITR